jgi:anti-sigma B factor antagonist
MQLKFHHESREDAVVVYIQGEVDLAVGDDFSSHLQAGLITASTHPAWALIIHLQAAALFGSAGLAALLKCHREGVTNGIAVAVVSTNPIVMRPIEVAKLGLVPVRSGPAAG